MPRRIVRHARGRYPVVIEPGATRRLAGAIATLAPGRRPFLISDALVARVVPVRGPWTSVTVPRGEAAKTRAVWASVTDDLIHHGAGRDCVLVALGGGSIGDLTGFVAATYLRGVPFISVPTTLLAMVDASVGGKTGINSPLGKNLIGAFHPPLGVVIDPAVVGSLPDRHYRGGLVEAIKHGLVSDRSYLRWIAASQGALRARDPATVTRLVARSVAIKAAIVARDEYDEGARVVLNAGHTVGHAIEQVSRFRVGHGDAVALGLIAETVVAERLGRAPVPSAKALVDWFRELGVPLRWPRATNAALLDAMGRDKKVAGGRLRMVLPRGKRAIASRGPWLVELSRRSVRQALETTRDLVAG